MILYMGKIAQKLTYLKLVYMVTGHNPLRTKPPALFLPTPDKTPWGQNPQNNHVGHNPLNFRGCFERDCFMFAVAILLIEDQHELHDLLQHDLLTPYNCNKPRSKETR